MKLLILSALLAVSAPSWAADDSAPLTMQDVQISYSAPAEKFIPTVARIHALPGAAKLRCVIAADGALSACAKVSEAPVGLGYLAATKAMASAAHVEPSAKDGTPTAGRTLLFERRFEFCKRADCEREARARYIAAGREP